MAAERSCFNCAYFNVVETYCARHRDLATSTTRKHGCADGKFFSGAVSDNESERLMDYLGNVAGWVHWGEIFGGECK